jgi:hypothetical protein
MKTELRTTVMLALIGILMPLPAWAIRISEATIQNGRVFIAGNHAESNAAISWEGVAVGINSNEGGAFQFVTTTLPPDCVGRLQIGTTSVDVVIGNCPLVVPQTGQTTSYATGDDGDLQKGAALPRPRFTDNRNGTVTDNLTALVWLANANCIASSYPEFDQVGIAGDGIVRWQQGLDFVAGINAGTYDCADTSGEEGTHATDWRLPNIRELHGLIDFGFFDPAISNAAGTGNGTTNDPFSNLQSVTYLSSTTIARIPSGFFFVYFQDGAIALGNKAGPHIGAVIAVRGGR